MSMSVSVSSSKKCPFVKCQQTAARPVAPYIYCCDHCHRLSMLCEKPRCDHLNRPFSRYCRHCHDETFKKNWNAGTAGQIWKNAGRYGKQGLGPAGSAETIVDLSQFLQEPQAMLAMRFIEGLLVVHQSGGFVGVFHPFQSTGEAGESPDATVWSGKELIRSRPSDRPFQPQLFADDKHLLFSSPAGVHALHLWSLPGWTYNDVPRYTPVVDASEADSPKLVAPPIALGEKRFGLIARDKAGKYFWATFDLTSGQTFHDETRPNQTRPLLLEGSPCQVLLAGNEAIGLATPKGHWIWRTSDARENNVDAMVRTWPQGPTHDTLLMDAEWEDSRHFHLSRQVLRHSRSREEGEPGVCEWLFAVGLRNAHHLYQYSIDLRTLKNTYPRDLELNGPDGALPIGIHEGSVHSVPLVRGPQLLNYIHGNVQDWQGAGAVDLVDDASGLIFHDPLMIILGSQREESRSVTIRSLHRAHPPARFVVGVVQADPIVWAGWLFTIEREGDRILLRRRAFGGTETHHPGDLPPPHVALSPGPTP